MHGRNRRKGEARELKEEDGKRREEREERGREIWISVGISQKKKKKKASKCVLHGGGGRGAHKVVMFWLGLALASPSCLCSV